jgi:hypothetical protein
MRESRESAASKSSPDASPAGEDQSPGWQVYTEYAKAELDLQHSRKDSLEQRGLAVVTTSGALVTLLFGLVAVLTDVTDFALPNAARPWLYSALGLFFLAALGALLTNAPLRYVTVKPEDLREAARTRWEDSAKAAHRKVFITRVNVMADTKRKNDLKGRVLLAAMAAEVLAVGSVGMAVRLVIANSP